MQHYDIVIIGAGLSGIDAACHFKMHCPEKHFRIFEARERLGGTWDLFKYPGIRSDSDMHVFSYSFKPWTYHKSISDAATILKYLNETAQEYDVAQHIEYNSPINKIVWSSTQKQWVVYGNNEGNTIKVSCNFLMICTGYYDYDQGYIPDFKGLDTFKGQFIHPQQWTKDIAYENREVIVIGSGATAVTLIPSLAEKTKHITMLQRSPSYILSQPLYDPFAKIVHTLLPDKIAHKLARWKNILRDMYLYKMSRKNPAGVKKYVKKQIRKVLGKEYAIDTHFSPKYNPWDERLCSVPDNDLFHAIKAGKCTVVTDHIDTFTKNGIRLQSGKELRADLVISATGLQLKLAGGIQVYLDDELVDLSTKLNYKGSMLQDLPNLAAIVGYTNAAWTLKADLACHYVCRLLNYMDANNYKACVPKRTENNMTTVPIINFTSGYIQRALDKLPKQGDQHPWRLNQNYIRDRKILKRDKINDASLHFER